MIQKTTLLKFLMIFGLIITFSDLGAQSLAFPEATGFGRYTTGARGAANPQIYFVTNLNDTGAGSFRDAVSAEGRFVIFKVGGIVNLLTPIAVAKNTTIAGQTATGEGIVFLGKVSFSGSNNTISRHLRVRYGGTAKDQDASGISNGANIILDHMTFTWATDEVFSINWDGKGTSPDNITIQNSIIGQGLHRHNHSAGGLMQPSGGKISLIGNLYICNKTRNNKIKGINEFVNNIVYNWGNFGNTYGHTESGEAYIMGGDSAGRSDVNIINNYFIGGPNTNSATSTPFNRGNDNFFLYGSGNYFDNNKNGVLDGALIPQDLAGYPTGDIATILSTPYDYPMKNTTLTAQDAFDKAVLSVGASYPRRDQVDNLMISDLMSKGTTATYLYVQKDLTDKFGFINGGAGHVYGAPAPLDTDNDGMPDAWEDTNGLNKNVFDGLTVSTTHAPYLNIEVYINGITNETPADFIIPPSDVNFANVTSTEVPAASSLMVKWTDNATNEDNYVVERSVNGTTFATIATIGANTTSYNDSGLTPNTKYYYRVKATNSTGFASQAKDIEWFGDSYTQGSGATVAANRFTSIVSKALGSTEVNHGVAGTTIQKRVPINYMAGPNMVDNIVSIPIKTVNKAMIVFAFGLNDMGQTAPAYTEGNYKTDYQFVIDNAVSKGWLPSQILIIPAYYIGSAGYAAYASITANAAPTQARHLSFIQAAKEVAVFNGTMYFDIYQDQLKNNTTLLAVDNIHPNDAGYTYIANDILQYLGQDKIIPRNISLSSVYGEIASLTTPPIPSAPTKATTPTPVLGYNFEELTNSNLVLKWAGSSNTVTYEVYFGTDAANLTKLGDVAYVTSPSYQVNGLSSGTNYFWRIDAVNAKGTATGDVWNFRTIANVPVGIVGHWPFAEAALDGEQIKDYSSYTNDGVLDLGYDNASVRVAGKVNNAIDFSTSPNAKPIVNIPNQDQLFLDKGSFTVSFWMKASAGLLPSGINSAYILCKGSMTKNAVTGATGKRFNVEVKSNLLRFAIDDDVTKKEVSASTANFYTGNWVNVVVMRDVTAHKLRIYTNGGSPVEVDETGVTGIAEVSDLVIGNIGAIELTSGTTPAPYKGQFDELKIFNHVLTATEVLDLYNNVSLSNEKFTKNKSKISIYPNPVKDQIFINIPGYSASSVTATLIDMTGRVIIKEKITSDGNGLFSLNITTKNTSGVYILNVSGDNLNSNFKIVAE
ncbi:MAG: GDSL-type esterase/lipase family protein [Bacteroidota bacterium]